MVAMVSRIGGEGARAPARRTARAAAAAGLLLLLGGCSSLEGLFDLSFLKEWFSGGSGDQMSSADGAVSTEAGARPSQDLEDLAARPPRISVGDRFSFDNPQVTWQVERIENDRIFWRADSGDEQVTGLNPILPALAWRSEGQGRGRRLITEMSEPFFPLRVGKRLTFKSTVSTDTPPYAWEFTWTCEMLRTERVEVPVGDFDTYVIRCGRQRPDELTFYYSPRVGHYVRMVSRPGAGSEKDRVTREMTDFLSRHYIAYVDPLTTAMSGEDDGMAAATPARPQAPESGGGAGEVTMVPLPELENPMDREDPRFDKMDGPVLVMPEGEAPRSALSGEGAARQQQAMSGEGRSAMAEKPATDQADAASAMQQPAMQQGAPQKQPAATATAPSQPASLPGAEMSGGTAVVHLASYKKPAHAERGWKQLSGENGDLLGSARPIVRRVDIPEKGVFYRLHAGPLASMADAKALCQALKARNLYCAAKQL